MRDSLQGVVFLFFSLACFSLASCSHPIPTQVWAASAWEVGEVKVCETYPDNGVFPKLR